MKSDRAAKTDGTKARAVREAQSLLQRFGFNGFSFHHLADALGIKAPSLYTHFKSKETLGLDLLSDYESTFAEWTETISFLEPSDKLTGLFEMFAKFSKDCGKHCPFVALSGDYHSLPKEMQKAVERFYKNQLTWITRVIEEGQKKKVFRKDVSGDELARMVLALGFGSQMVGRVSKSPERIRELKATVLRLLKTQ